MNSAHSSTETQAQARPAEESAKVAPGAAVVPTSAAESGDVAGELGELRTRLERELRDAGLRAAALRAENEYLREKNYGLVEADRQHTAFIAHLQETIANCHRELAGSPFHRIKDLGHRILKRMGLRP